MLLYLVLQEKTDWDSAKRVLGDATFIDRLISYDKDNITERIRRELRRVVADPAFTPDQVRDTRGRLHTGQVAVVVPGYQHQPRDLQLQHAIDVAYTAKLAVAMLS